MLAGGGASRGWPWLCVGAVHGAWSALPRPTRDASPAFPSAGSSMITGPTKESAVVTVAFVPGTRYLLPGVATHHVGVYLRANVGRGVLSKAGPKAKPCNSVGCLGKQKSSLLGFSTLKLPPTLLLWLALWREGEIVFFELYDLKGHGQKIPPSFTIFS